MRTGILSRSVAVIMVVITATGCSALGKITAEQAAALDTATTVVAVEQGYRELNPLGFPATVALKITVLVVADSVASADSQQIQKIASTVWTAAAVNNVVLLLTGQASLGVAAALIYLEQALTR